MKKLSLALALAVTCVLLAQDKVDAVTSAKIRSEELEHSQIMHIEHMIADRYGPRMTGTPNHEAAVDWVIAETTKWGMKNAHKEPWNFNRAGWLNERAWGFINSPVRENLKFEVLAWTPSTNGTVNGSAVQLEAPPHGPPVPPAADAAAAAGRGGRGGPQFQGPTQSEMDAWIAANQNKVRGKISQIMHIEHMIADRYGPRMTGTPNHEAAVDWVIAETTKWGMKNAHKEPWNFNRAGWLNERAWGFINSPVRENLKFEVLAWTPSTNGTVNGSAVQLEAPPHGPPVPPAADAAAAAGRGGRGGPQFQGPTQSEMDAWIAANQNKVRGKMVMIGKAAVIPVDFNEPAKRRPDDQVKAQYENPNGGGGRGRGGAGGRGAAQAEDGRLTARQVGDQIDAMLIANGALVRMNDAARAMGIIVAQQHPAYDVTKTVPTVILRNDDYGRIERLLADGDDVKLEYTIVNHTYPEGKTSYNVIAEIPGSDKRDEIVMLGGHLDSWHSATGGTDNGIGSSIMLEAARLIQSLGLKPRRTVRVALWSGEEEGLLGSLAYVREHFGTAEDPKPEFAKLDCYFNVDTGTGRLRGAGVFGPPEAAATLRGVFALFTDWGLFGVSSSHSRATGGTDSTSFNNAGLPGIGYQQDPIEYNSMTHHTNLDTYERIIPEDVKEAAAEVAAAVWQVANRDQMIPRFTKETMPAPVAAR